MSLSKECLSQSIAKFFNMPLRESLDIGTREIGDLNCYYHLQNKTNENGNFESFSTIYSDLSELLPLNCRVSINPNQRINRLFNAEFNKVEEIINDERRATINDNLKKKRNRTKLVIDNSI